MTTKIPNPFEVLNRPNPFKPAMPNPFDSTPAEIVEPNPFESMLAKIAEIMQANPAEVVESRPRLREILIRYDERGRMIG